MSALGSTGRNRGDVRAKLYRPGEELREARKRSGQRKPKPVDQTHSDGARVNARCREATRIVDPEQNGWTR